METFNTTEGESQYIQWIRAHPTGVVVNTYRPRPTPGYLKLHVASCWTIGVRASGGGRLTGRQYQKVCSASRDELEEWARTVVGGELSPCGTCWRTGSLPRRVATAQTGLISTSTHDTPDTRAAMALVGPLPRRWRPGKVLIQVDRIRPLLASWNAGDNPAKLRLEAYLDDLERRLGINNLPHSGLYLDLVVDIEVKERLSRHYDLDNYLTPIALRLGWDRFVHGRAIKRLGGGSSLRIGTAIEDPLPLSRPWVSMGLDAGSGSSQKPWKEGIRHALATANVELLAPGPVSVSLSWRCRRETNWVNLWKPTGDAMGPVLGESDPRNPFNVADDRIVELLLHRDVDSGVGRQIHIGLAWHGGA